MYQQITLFLVRSNVNNNNNNNNNNYNNNNNNNNEITFNGWSIDLPYPNFVTHLFEPFTR